MISTTIKGIAVAGAVLAGQCGIASAAEIKLVAANAVKGALADLVSAFETASGHTVSIVWTGTEAATKRISDGEAVDVVIIGASNIERLITQGRVSGSSRADIARSGVGIAVRSGLPKPDISTSEAVKTAVLAAKSIVYSTGPSGFYVAELFKRMGIADQIKDRVVQPPSGAQAGEILARGDADLGFQQVSELIHIKGIDYLGPLPPDIQNVTVYAAGIPSASGAPEAARALIEYIRSPAAAPAIRKAGMEPG